MSSPLKKKPAKTTAEAPNSQPEGQTSGLDYTLGGLSTAERFWRSQYRWLQSNGYQLRQRLDPDWVPSWQGTSKPFYRCSDGLMLPYPRIVDAIRTKDGTEVTLKKVDASVYPYEAEIMSYLSSDPLASDPHNHSVPLYDVIQVPDAENLALLVMPLLRTFDDPRFDTIGETVEFFRQIFEGLQFMHQHHIAHLDCTPNNVMMEAKNLYPEGFHYSDHSKKKDFSGAAKHFTRTQRPPRYYFIDFGLSRRFAPDDPNPLTVPILGGDKSVPEFASGAPVNPFSTDVYYIGNIIRERFILSKSDFQFMKPLIDDMVQRDPSKRPSMNEVVTRYGNIAKELSSWKLRSRVYEYRENPVIGIYYGMAHWIRRFTFVVKRVPAVPSA